MMKASSGGSCKSWLLSSWKGPREESFERTWQNCDTADSEVEQIVCNMRDVNDGTELARAIAGSCTLEAILRDIASQANYNETGDSRMSDHMKILTPPGGDVAPSWLVGDGRKESAALYHQGQRLRSPRGGGQGEGGDNVPAAPPVKELGRVIGGARGKARGATAPQA